MHLHTLHIEHSVLLAVFTLLTAVNARLQRHLPGVRYFALYNVLALLGSLAVALRGDILDALSITLGNMFVIAAYLALYESMSQLFGLRRRLLVVPVSLALAGAAAMVWWGSLRPDTPKRLLAYSLLLGSEQLFVGIALLCARRETRQVSWMLSGILLVLAAANAVRFGAVALGGAPQDYLRSGPLLAAIILLNTCLQCGLMLAYVWMTAALLRRDLEVRASTDPLTGLLNRRALDAAAALAVAAINEGKGVFAATVLDLDKYKELNDRLGHVAGDHALKAVSYCLKRELRTSDLIARTGGDEFVLLLPRTPGKEAARIAERLRDCLQQLDLGLSDPLAEITGSFGVAEAMPGESWEDLLERCDGALYAAKRSGGNAVFRHEAGQHRELEQAI